MTGPPVRPARLHLSPAARITRAGRGDAPLLRTDPGGGLPVAAVWLAGQSEHS